MGQPVHLLPHRTERNNGLSGRGRVIKPNDAILLGQITIPPDNQVQQGVGRSIVGHKHTDFLAGVFLVPFPQNVLQDGLVLLIGPVQLPQNHLMSQTVGLAIILKPPDAPVGRDAGICRGVDMDQNITLLLLQQGSRLPSSRLIVGIHAAHELVLPLDGHHRDLKLSQLLGGEGVAQYNHALDLIGEQLFDVPALALLIIVADKHQEFIAKGLVSGQNLVEHL